MKESLVAVKVCLRCGDPIPVNKKKFCCDSCKYWFNLIKKERESGMAPAKKRNENFFSMVTGSYVCSGPGSRGNGQGRRSGGTVRGSMAARVECTVEEWVSVTRENLDRHFAGIPGYWPGSIRLGTNEKISREKAYELLSKLECQQQQKIM